MKIETKEWLEKAEKDFRTAEVNLKNKIYDAAAFFCQQAIEKALKALEIEKLGKISEYYVETRYPDTYAVFDKAKVSGAIEKTKKVTEWIKTCLKA